MKPIAIELDELRRSMRACIDTNSERFREPIRLLLRMLSDGYMTLNTLKVHPENQREVVVGLLWARCLEHCEATLTMLCQSLFAPAQTSLRALHEAMLTLRAVAKDDDLLTRYLNEDHIFRKKLVDSAMKAKNGSFKQHVTSELIEEIEKEVRETSSEEISVWEYCQKADLPNEYIAYRLLSSAAHSKVRSLEKYLDTDESGRVIIKQPILEDDFVALLATAGCSMIAASEGLHKVFGIGIRERESLHSYFCSITSTKMTSDCRILP